MIFIKQQIRRITTINFSINYAKVIPNNLKGKNKSSQEWLIRQLADPYVEKAKIMNYRCRSAFKLLEIDDKYKIFKPGDVVIDCGAAPGSWSQIAAKRTNSDGTLGEEQPKGIVISIDLLPIHPINGVIILNNMDFTKSIAHEKIHNILDGRTINTVISDMAPNATGIKSLDQDRIIELCYSVLKLSILQSAIDSNLLMKVWDNPNVTKLENYMQKFYKNVKRIKPKASRLDSSESFLLAKGFYGIEK